MLWPWLSSGDIHWTLPSPLQLALCLLSHLLPDCGPACSIVCTSAHPCHWMIWCAVSLSTHYTRCCGVAGSCSAPSFPCVHLVIEPPLQQGTLLALVGTVPLFEAPEVLHECNPEDIALARLHFGEATCWHLRSAHFCLWVAAMVFSLVGGCWAHSSI